MSKCYAQGIIVGDADRLTKKTDEIISTCGACILMERRQWYVKINQKLVNIVEKPRERNG